MAGARQALIKEDYKNVIVESKITSYWSNVGDPNLGQIDMKKFQSSLYTTKPTGYSKMMMDSGIVKVVGFPLAVQCYELIVECARHYDPNRRVIVTLDGREIAYLSEEAIGEAFHIPQFKNMIYKNSEGAKIVYDADPDKRKPRISKLLGKLHRIDLKEEFGDLITLLR